PMATFDFRFERHCRTANSESYLIKRDAQDIGMVDLHFTVSAVYGTLSVVDGLDSDEVQELIELIDEDLVRSEEHTSELQSLAYHSFPTRRSSDLPMATFDFRFERHCRTANSESYLIKRDAQDIGMVDLHFTVSAVYGTLSVVDGLDSDEVQELIELIDEDLV